MVLSPGAYYHVIKLVSTIADLAAAEQISTAHIAEALQCRPRVTDGQKLLSKLFLKRVGADEGTADVDSLGRPIAVHFIQNVHKDRCRSEEPMPFSIA